jgi:hypothetical protein
MTERLLKSHLEPLARRSQQWQLWRALALCWLVLGLVAFGAILAERLSGWSSPLIFFALGAAAVISGALVALRFRARPLDYQELARQIERENPELHAVLLTAVEQQPLSPTGELNYLQQRVVLEALEHYRRSEWAERIGRRHYAALGAQWVALGFLVAMLVALRPHISLLHPGQLWAGMGHSNAITVTPGDASLERGSALVVLARFEGKLPAEAQLVINPVNANEQNIPLTKNLDDPVFGGGLPQIQGDLKYHIQYTSGRTRDYSVTVFDYPKLNHADVTISYPVYTGLPDKTIKDTRRVSAVEESSLAYSFFLNKPVVKAQWVPKDGPAISLTVDATNATIYHTKLTLDQSHRYALVLVDDAGRTNKLPPEFVLDALKDRPAMVKIDSPRGDPRVSPLAEINFAAEASGEFGLHSYGIAYTLADGETRSVELGQSAKAGEKRQFNYLLPLESLGAQPDQLLSYYVWADDTGPDGQPRRNASDIFFAEIKPFDEIFREGQAPSGDANQNQGGGRQSGDPPEQLADLEKDITTATWNIKRRETDAKPSDKYKDDLGVVRDSQQQALEQLRTMKAQSDDPRSQLLMGPVEREMNKAATQLDNAVAKNSTAPLPAALSAEQSAYQALLKLMAREYQVTRARGQRGGGGGGRSQRQLDELDLQQQADRYESERQASSQQTPQQREQLQVASRLKDLAKRQQDLNDRLRELQAELQQARTPQERADLQDQLKRLTDEQRDMLADLDELKQRMDNTENQSQMQEQRQQLDQTRSELQSAAESLGRNATSQALASGTRAQNELQQVQDEVRKMNSGQFTDDMRRMRNDAHQLSQNEQDLEKQISDLADNQKLGETDEQRQQRANIATQLTQQKHSVSNLVDQMRQVSEQSETAEPLLSSQLYDTIRQTGLDQLDNSLDTASEYVRRGFLRQATPAEAPARQNIDQLKNGIDRAADSILGDNTEALRQAQRELQQLSQELNQGLADNANGRGTNGTARANGGREGQPGANQGAGAEPGQASPQQADAQNGQQGAGEQNGQNDPNGQGGRRGNGQRGGGQDQAGQPSDQQAENGDGQGNGGQQGQRGPRGQNGQAGQAGQAGQNGSQPGDQPGNGRGGEQGQGQGQGRGQGQGQGQGQNNELATADGARNGERGQRGGAHGAGGWNHGEAQPYDGPITSGDYVRWTDGLRDVEEMVDVPDVSTEVARIREAARTLHLEYKQQGKRPDWAVISTQISAPLAEVRERVNEELLKRQSKDALVPLDRDPVPPKYSDQVKRYYEQLGKTD